MAPEQSQQLGEGTLTDEIVDRVEMGVFVVDREQRVRIWNRWLECMSGLPRADCHGRPWLDVFPSLAGTRLATAIEEALESGLPALLSQSLNRSPLPLRTEHQSIQVVPIGSRSRPWCLVQVFDTGSAYAREQLLRAQAVQLREAQQRQEALLNSIPDIALLKSRDGHYLAVNPPFARLVGRSPEAVQGKTDFDLWPVATALSLRDEDALVISRRHPVRLEVEIRDADGRERWLEKIKAPVFDPLGDVIGIACTARDISERKCAERDLDAQRERLERTVASSSAEIAALSAHLQSVREDEKAKLARELHDELGAALALFKLDLCRIAARVQQCDPALGAEMGTLSESLDGAVHAVRRFITSLRPTLLDDLGLGAAIRWQVQQFQQRTGIRCRASVQPADPVVPDACAIALFRVLQESLTNVVRHAQATLVEVRFESRHGKFRLSVRDNGVGIGTEQAQSPLSHGLRGMQARLEPLGGSLEVSSCPDSGTLVCAVVPTQVGTDAKQVRPMVNGGKC